jgi:hypothetical protein
MPDSSYKLRCLGAIRSTASLSPASYARLNSSLSSSSWLVRRERGGVAKLFDREGKEQQTGEECSHDSRVDSEKDGGDVDELEHP